MMEIPAGKWCTNCAFQEFGDDGEELCGLFDHVMTFHDRLPACLSAYPNGATITITAKEQTNDRL